MNHQQHQIKIIDQIEEQIKSNSLRSSTVSPVTDFENDPRICLTSVHFPSPDLKSYILESIINPLKEIAPEYHYYSDSSLHMTIKNIRVINNPPHFTHENKEVAREVFSKVIPRHKKFPVYFYRLLLFPNNLALMGTTDPELDNIIIDLDKELKKAGVPDDKIYISSQRFFSNTTLARFNSAPTREFLKRVEELSKSLSFEPYVVNSVTLLTCNAVFFDRNIVKT